MPSRWPNRGLQSLYNQQKLGAFELSVERKKRVVLAVSKRRHAEFVALLQLLQVMAGSATEERVEEMRWKAHLQVVAHDPEQVKVPRRPRRSHRRVGGPALMLHR